MNKQTSQIIHKAALEIVNTSKGDIDRIEVIIRQVVRDALTDSLNIKPSKKNPNRDYVSE